MTATRIVRSHLLTEAQAQGVPYAVYQGEQMIGHIACNPGHFVKGYGPLKTRWHVADAGSGVPVGRADYDDEHQAAKALVDLRATSPALAIDASGLTQIERDVLDFEARFAFVRDNGAKHSAIHTLFAGMSMTRYTQILNRLIGPSDGFADPAAFAYQPVVVTRLRRLREQRLAQRGRLATA